MNVNMMLTGIEMILGWLIKGSSQVKVFVQMR